MSSLSWFLWLLLLLLLLSLLMLRHSRDPPGFPPGPPALPLLGNIFSIEAKQPHIYLTKLSEVYGSIFCVRLGRHEAVFINGWGPVREVLLTQGDQFRDRPFSPMVHRLYHGDTAGLFFSNGGVWRRQRRFAMATLRTLGQNRTEQSISEESTHLQEAMEEHRGAAFDPAPLLTNAVANIICRLVFGRRFDYSDRDFQLLLQDLTTMAHLEGSIWALLYDAFPSLMKILPGPHNQIFSSSSSVQNFIRREVNAHKLTLDPRNQDPGNQDPGNQDPGNPDPGPPQDYIHAFLTEEMQHRGGGQGFEEENLVLCCLDLFLAGSETTSRTLQWGLIYLIQDPQVQARAQEEIDRVIGRSRRPNMADRPRLPYTNAVLHEVQRLGNVVPLNGFRRAAKDTTLGGYHIPKGTSVMPNLTSVLFDRTQWETPHSFNPGHFLNHQGEFVRKEAFLPFSAGKRVCLGAALARMELFLFFVTLLQRFWFSCPDGVQLRTDGITGATRAPHPFKIHATPR